MTPGVGLSNTNPGSGMSPSNLDKVSTAITSFVVATWPLLRSAGARKVNAPKPFLAISVSLKRVRVGGAQLITFYLTIVMPGQ